MKLITRCLSVLLLSAPVLTWAQDNPKGEPYAGAEIKGGAVYRGNLRRSGVFQKTGVSNLAGPLWKTSLGGKINSSPVVYQDTLYIGAQGGFYALDAGTGNVKWKYETSDIVDSSACVADTTVCFTTLKSELIALDTADGKLRWRYLSRNRAENSRSSPAIAYGVVFSPVGRQTVAVKLTDGKLLWAYDEQVPQEYSSLALSADTIYAAGIMQWGFLWAYNYETGQVRWHSNYPYGGGAGDCFYKSPAVDETGHIYYNSTGFVSKFSPTPPSGSAKGENRVLWQAHLLDKAVEMNELIPQPSPTVWQGKVYAGRYDGKMACLDAKDGKVLWVKKYPATILSDASLAAKSGLLYFGCRDGHVYALTAETGEEKWKFKTGGDVLSSPWIGDGVVYVASYDGFVYALK